jgi:hypothetical protein
VRDVKPGKGLDMRTLIACALLAGLSFMARDAAAATVIDITGPDTVLQDTATEFTFTYSDDPPAQPYNSTVFTIGIEWGDGSSPDLVQPATGSGSFTLFHAYDIPGITYTIQAFFLAQYIFPPGGEGPSSESHITSDSHDVTAVTPIPPALLLFATALGGLGFAGWRRRRNTGV